MVKLDQQGQEAGDGLAYTAFRALPSGNSRYRDAEPCGELRLRHVQLLSLDPKLLASLAEVRASSEAGHPILLAFDEGWGPGATHWKAGDPGEQVITVALREPCALGQVTLQVEEREVARTQEVQLALSTDVGVTYREVVRQEFTFSPEGATWEDEGWAVRQDHVTHVRLVIKPDKGGRDVYAALTSFGLWPQA